MIDPIHTSVLLTGASGYVGCAFCDRLRAAGHTVRPAVRSGLALPDEVVVGDIRPSTDWRAALEGSEVVLHLAERGHTARGSVQNSLALYREIDIRATLDLASQAALAGVRRFVFISAIKAMVKGATSPIVKLMSLRP